jgi:pyruvate dehydrogenase E2 component (dihydrolipoamide acetyltransferase)
MPINILMPALSPTMEEGNLASWHVKEGDSISAGDVIAEIETDKATMEVEAVEEGVIAKILVEAGAQGVKVNEIIAILAEEGEDPASISGPAEDGKAPASNTPATGDVANTPEAKTSDEPGPTKAQGHGKPDLDAGSVSSSGSHGQKLFASPLARRLAKENNLDLNQLKGSGPKGRIVQRDIEEALEKGIGKAGQKAPAPAKAPQAAPAGMADKMVLKLFEEGSYETVPHDGMRKTIARRLQESKQTVPHFYVTVDVELDALLALRKEMNDAAPVVNDKPAYKLSVNDLVIKAHALALRAVPEANVTWTDGAMLKHKHADVGVAVSIDGGLITPIVRKACHKSLSAISNEMKDFAKRAKERKLKPEEYQGGTTAVSNMGMFGVKDFAAVINPPHATILAVGAGEQRPVVKNGALAVATVMSVTLSTDHRAVDGALGAELLQAFKGYIEKPMSMLV